MVGRFLTRTSLPGCQDIVILTLDFHLLADPLFRNGFD